MVKNSEIIFVVILVAIIASATAFISVQWKSDGRNIGSSDNCSMTQIAETGETYYSIYEDCYFQTHSPMDYINDIKSIPEEIVTVMEIPAGWVTREDVSKLMLIVDSKEPAAAFVSMVSSYIPFNESSTVGNEAMFLIEGYRKGHYPPALCSLYYFKPNVTEIKEWWEAHKNDTLDEYMAISLIQNDHPEYSTSEYPSDGLPPKSIKTEKASNGWYVAFIDEGSGIPIIMAKCFRVSDDRYIENTGNYTPTMDSFITADDFSPAKCG